MDYTGQGLGNPTATTEGIIIPTPEVRVSDSQTPTGTAVLAQWRSESKEFLTYNPEYFLFRHSVGHWTESTGYRHPSHQNGSKYPAGSWFAGIDNDAINGQNPGRDTEWAIGAEGVDTLTIPKADFRNWFTGTGRNIAFPSNGVYPCPDPTTLSNPNEIGPSGRSMASTRQAYFFFRIAIDIEDPNTGCPKTFGPRSETFTMRSIVGTGGLAIVSAIGSHRIHGS